MIPIHLLPVGAVDPPLFDYLRPALAAEFGVDCHMIATPLDASDAFHEERQQYHSSELLAQIAQRTQFAKVRLVGVTGFDLYIPILTFVFGEAELGGSNAIISYHRLRQEFYGLDPDPFILEERLVKEAVHEVGHTLGLRHCDNYECAMAPSHSVEWIDLKGTHLCRLCRSKLRLH